MFIEIPEVLKAVLYGVLEGVTEWLPVSSTGHLLLAEKLIPFVGVSEKFFGMFDVVIQLGAILAVVVLFWKEIFPFDLGRRTVAGKRVFSFVKMDILSLWFKIMVSCIPAAVIGFLYDDVFEALFYRYEVIAGALIVFGVAFIAIENWNKGRRPGINGLSEITYQTAFLIGVFQLIAAVFPGTSRSGATIVGALLIGVSRTVAAEYTFFLAIPVMFGASLLKIAKFGLVFSPLEAVLLATGTVAAFVVSLVILKFLIGYLKKHDFKVFGWYRIILGIVVFLTFRIGF